ncbi:hypothetical protein ASG90_08320 [Nocardioides sp. Soil797]|nr:hypothetical protein ASG90_08320 [Nocardioides sp. Soil797]
MRNRSKVLIGVGAGLAVMAGIVVAVQLLDGSDGGVTGAAEVLPADTEWFTYVDRDAWAERVGLDDIEHDYSDDDMDRFVEASRDSSVGTPLSRYLGVMKDAAFNEFDVDWQVSGTSGSAEQASPPWNIYRMDDDLDLGDVADALEDAGWSRDEIDGHPRLSIDLDDVDEYGLVGDYPANKLLDVTIVEDDHLMIASSDPEPVLDVIDGDADALADDDDFDELSGSVDDTELAQVRLGDDFCAGQAGRMTSPEESAQLSEQSGIGDLGTPEATGYFQEADGDDATSVGVLVFSSDDAADTDAEAREQWLKEGLDPRTLSPMSEYLDLESVEADGRSVIARGTFETERIGAQMAFENGGLTTCSPTG